MPFKILIGQGRKTYNLFRKSGHAMAAVPDIGRERARLIFPVAAF
jgi:hypothetical protein